MRHLAVLLFGIAVSVVSAHPGHEHTVNFITRAKREAFHSSARASLANCIHGRESRELAERTHARRHELHQSLLAERAGRTDTTSTVKVEAKSTPTVKDGSSVIATNHHSSLTGLGKDTASSQIFSGNVSCILVPEVTQGPFYVDGELIRSDVRESQAGNDIYVDIQLVDVKTCKPIVNAYIDWWHANATGVYSGVVSNINGDGTDLANINRTAFRGLQPTDANGAAQFLSNFPAHYNGRANHVHMLIHLNGTVLPNNTFKSGPIVHVGQLFFDQDLITQIEANAPYNTNSQTLTTTAEDMIFQQEAATSDPIPEYVLLGDNVKAGVLMWITIGVDTTANYTVGSASTWTANGGVANANGGGGGFDGTPGVGGPGGNGAPGQYGGPMGGPMGGQMGTPPSGAGGMGAPPG